MDYVDRLGAIHSQVLTTLHGVVMDDAIKVSVRCACGAVHDIGARSLVRRWSGKARYLCKSCHVKTYAGDPVVQRKRRASVRALGDDYRRKMSANARAMWAKPGMREHIAIKTAHDNRVNPKKAEGRKKGLAALMAKRPNHMAEIRQLVGKTSKIQLHLYSMLDELGVIYYRDDSEKCRIGYFVFDCRIDVQEGIKLSKPLLIEVQ